MKIANKKYLTIEFTNGEFDKDVFDKIAYLAPFLKIAVLFNQECDLINLKKFSIETKKRGNRSVFIEIRDSNLTVDNLSNLFSLHEDIRLIVSLNKELTPFAEYFATVKNIPIIEIASSITDVFFDSVIFIRNKKNLDPFYLTSNKTILISGYNNQDKIKLYAFIENLLFSLFDFYLKMIIFGEKNYEEEIKKLYHLLSEAKTELFNKNLNINIIINALIDAYNINRNNHGVFFSYSVGKIIENVFQKKLSVFESLAYSIDLLTFFQKDSLLFCDDLTNYNEIALTLSNEIGIEKSKISKALLGQINLFSNINEEKLLEIKKILKKGINYFNDLKKRLLELSVYPKTTNEKERILLNKAGCTPYAINLATIFRELNLVL